MATPGDGREVPVLDLDDRLEGAPQLLDGASELAGELFQGHALALGQRGDVVGEGHLERQGFWPDGAHAGPPSCAAARRRRPSTVRVNQGGRGQDLGVLAQREDPACQLALAGVLRNEDRRTVFLLEARRPPRMMLGRLRRRSWTP